MPVGSVVSQYESDIALKRSLPQDARVKAGWFAACNMREHHQWASRHPSIYASTSTKYEWGKVRALYGCDVTSFLHSDFAMANCEDTLPEYFPVGRKANDENVKRAIATFTDGVPLCYDFDDFNSQHSSASMTAVIEAWRSVFAHSLSDEQKVSLDWTCASVADQTVRFNDVGTTERISGTLLSGWRLTSFVNTVLNRVYLLHAGLEGNVNYALHNGDDMYATTPTVAHAMRLVKNAKELGIRAQLAKTNIGTIGEFLRVDTRAQNKTSAQYLARAVSTAVHGRVEMAPANDFRATVASMSTRFDEMRQRGADVSTTGLIEKHAVEYLTDAYEQTADDVATVKALHPIQGGTNKRGDVGRWKIEVDVTGAELLTDLYEPLRPGLNDYANYVVERLGVEFDVPDRSQMFSRMVRALTKPKKRYKKVIDTEPMIHVYRGLYGAWKTDTYVNEIALARSLGYVAAKTLPGVKGPLATFLRKSKEPLKLMSILL
jgi:hypothetical protein